MRYVNAADALPGSGFKFPTGCKRRLNAPPSFERDEETRYALELLSECAATSQHSETLEFVPKNQARFSNRVIPTKMTAPMKATMIDPIMPPPAEMPSCWKIQPPRTPPRSPRTMSAIVP